MSFRSERFGKYLLRIADESDNDGIRAIFESGSFSGGLNVQFLRGESPLASFRADGDEAKILVVEDTEEGRLIAVGGAVIRTEFLNGLPARCAYLTGLKVHHDYRGKLAFIPRAYAVMRELLSDCAVTYTTILDGNTGVIKMLEKRRKNMPKYRFLGHYTTFCLGRGKPIRDVEINDLTGFDELMKRHFSSRSLMPCIHEYEGFGKKDFYCIRDSLGEIMACCFISDQSGTKYYRMCSYGGVYKLASHLPTALLGYPSFPRSGEVIKNGIVSYLYVKDSEPALCGEFLRSAAYKSGYPMLLWGCMDSDPLYGALSHLRTVKYGSRLYEVVWHGTPCDIRGNIGVEAALL